MNPEGETLQIEWERVERKTKKTQSSCGLTSECRGSALAAARAHLRNGSQEANCKTANSSHWNLHSNTKMQICTISFLGPLHCLPFRFTVSKILLAPNFLSKQMKNKCLFFSRFWKKHNYYLQISERCRFLWNPQWLPSCGCFSSEGNGAQSHRCRHSSAEAHQIT